VLHVTAFTYRAKKAGQLVGGQEVRELVGPWRLGEPEVLPGPLADVAELIVTESLAASEAYELGN
jgi:hypothetical protein